MIPIYESDRAPLKTLKGSIIQRSKKYGVGKEIGGQIYFHKDYVDLICPDLYKETCKIISSNMIAFHWNCLMYDKSKPHQLRFDEALDFDSAREPCPGDMLIIDLDNPDDYKNRHSDQIWHHKWLWVMDDYKGFNVNESYEWSKLWLSKISHPSGYINKWKQELADVGLK